MEQIIANSTLSRLWHRADVPLNASTGLHVADEVFTIASTPVEAVVRIFVPREPLRDLLRVMEEMRCATPLERCLYCDRVPDAPRWNPEGHAEGCAFVQLSRKAGLLNATPSVTAPAPLRAEVTHVSQAGEDE